MEHLERAQEELVAASENTSETVQLQIQTIREGVFEEDAGDRTQDGPGPKVDRLAEVSDKLGGLVDEIEDPQGAEHVQTAREHVQTYLREHPDSEKHPEAEGTDDEEATVREGESGAGDRETAAGQASSDLRDEETKSSERDLGHSEQTGPE